MTVRFLRLTPMLQTQDLQRTIDWYETVLAFRCTGRADGWCMLERDGAKIMFMHNDHLGAPQATATQYIEVDDVRALWGRIGKDVRREWGPEEMSYGMLEFAIRDPNGYLLSFGQPIGR
jgi:uncharacterized glyoxalase superfamily protein PhnB